MIRRHFLVLALLTPLGCSPLETQSGDGAPLLQDGELAIRAGDLIGRKLPNPWKGKIKNLEFEETPVGLAAEGFFATPKISWSLNWKVRGRGSEDNCVVVTLEGWGKMRAQVRFFSLEVVALNLIRIPAGARVSIKGKSEVCIYTEGNAQGGDSEILRIRSFEISEASIGLRRIKFFDELISLKGTVEEPLEQQLREKIEEIP